MARTLSTEARNRVLVAARHLLVADGIGSFTVDAVASASGVAKTTIYRHFASSHDLLVAALDFSFAPVPTPNTGTLRGDLLAYFARMLPAAEDDELRTLMMGVLNAGSHDADMARVADTALDQRLEPLRTVLQLAVARGEIRADVSLDHAVDLVGGPLFLHLFVRRLPVTTEDVEALVDLAARGLGAR